MQISPFGHRFNFNSECQLAPILVTSENVSFQAKDPNVVVDRGAVTGDKAVKQLEFSILIDGGGGSTRGPGVGGEVLWNPNLECSYLAPNYDGNASYLLPRWETQLNTLFSHRRGYKR